MEETVKSASFDSKSSFKLPEGAVIIKKDFNIRVEEIENGFIITKNYDIKYQMPDDDDTENKYEYYSKKWFSKTNPLKIDMKETKEESLSDKME